MTDTGSDPGRDLVGLSISGRIAQFAGLATERVRLVYADRSRLLRTPEPFETPDLARLVRAVRRCL